MDIKTRIMKEIVDIMPDNIKGNKVKVIIQHFNEAWRCWKANLEWKIDGMP
jgi:pre-mRNA-processing factor 8